MLRYDFEESIGYWLTLSTQAFHRAVSEEVAPHGITYRQAVSCAIGTAMQPVWARLHPSVK
jgi:hypothetical protein